MVNNYQLLNYLNKILDIDKYIDYCPNGLQIEGVDEVKHITLGVSISDALIERAIANNSQAILVHHGIFWNKDSYLLNGIKKKRIEKLIKHDINLYAYHLPLDNHSRYGNNAQLGQILGIYLQGTYGYQNLIWHGELEQPVLLSEFSEFIKVKLARKPLIFGKREQLIKKIAWCTGGGDGFFTEVLDLGVDLYISGEAAEPTMALANESGVAYIAAGHYATERFGVQALGEHLMNKFEVEVGYEEIFNPI